MWVSPHVGTEMARVMIRRTGVGLTRRLSRPVHNADALVSGKFTKENGASGRFPGTGGTQGLVPPQWDQRSSDGAISVGAKAKFTRLIRGQAPIASLASQRPAFDVGVTVTGGDHDVTRNHSMDDRGRLCRCLLRECNSRGAV